MYRQILFSFLIFHFFLFETKGQDINQILPESQYGAFAHAIEVLDENIYAASTITKSFEVGGQTINSSNDTVLILLKIDSNGNVTKSQLARISDPLAYPIKIQKYDEEVTVSIVSFENSIVIENDSFIKSGSKFISISFSDDKPVKVSQYFYPLLEVGGFGFRNYPQSDIYNQSFYSAVPSASNMGFVFRNDTFNDSSDWIMTLNFIKYSNGEFEDSSHAFLGNQPVLIDAQTINNQFYSLLTCRDSLKLPNGQVIRNERITALLCHDENLNFKAYFPIKHKAEITSTSIRENTQGLNLAINFRDALAFNNDILLNPSDGNSTLLLNLNENLEVLSQKVLQTDEGDVVLSQYEILENGSYLISGTITGKNLQSNEILIPSFPSDANYFFTAKKNSKNFIYSYSKCEKSYKAKSITNENSFVSIVDFNDSFSHNNEKFILPKYYGSVLLVNYSSPTVQNIIEASNSINAIFPNPTIDQVVIRNVKGYTIYNLQREKIYKGNEEKISFVNLNLPKGIYLFQITDLNGAKTIKKVIYK